MTEIKDRKTTLNIRRDIKKRLERKKRGYTINEIMQGYELQDTFQLLQLKSLFPKTYAIIEEELEK